MIPKKLLTTLSLTCLLLSACASPTPTPVTIVPTGTATPMPTITPSPVPLPPILAANEHVNCYSGPGETGYVLVATFEQGDQMDVVGRDSSNGYWIVIDRKGGKGCWIEQKYATVEGQVDSPPALVPPPTVVARPKAPSNLDIKFNCQRSGPSYRSILNLAITITWEDNSTNEGGFEIYKNGNLLKTLDADMTEAHNDIQSDRTILGSAVYEVLAFNGVGKSTRITKTVTYHCP